MKKMHSLKNKSFVVIAVMILVISSTLLYISYKVFSSTLDNYYSETAQAYTDTIALAVDQDEIAYYSDAVMKIYRENFENYEKDPEAYLKKFDAVRDSRYEEIRDKYTGYMGTCMAKSLYVVYFDYETKNAVYVIDGDRTETTCPPGFFESLAELDTEFVENLGSRFKPNITNYPQFGWLVTAGAPITASDGRVVGYAMIDISMNEIKHQVYEFANVMVASIMLVAIILSVVVSFVINLNIVEPITKLASAAANFSAGSGDGDTTEGKKQLQQLLDLNINSNDELQILSDSMMQMEMDILTYIDHLTKVMAEKQRIGAELNVATKIQADMLPMVFPDSEYFDIFASMTPAKEVGGDFYDFLQIDDTHLMINVSDVSGKGVPAAMVMVIGKTLLNISASNGLQPGDILSAVNNHLCHNPVEDMFITSWIGIIDLTTGVMTCASAGHEYPAIYRKDKGFELFKDKHSIVLGGFEDAPYKEYTLEFNPGDKLFVYTDGVPEATDKALKMFGTDRMIDTLNELDASASCKDILTHVKQSVDNFVGSAPPFDDLTMVGFELKKLIK